ncbi:MAG TPA: hypothetical protein VH141_31130 [Pseudonocardia sp.]|jgi:hypothetical protein|nr:hypothetical protein [Pseudonocardia sp.]
MTDIAESMALDAMIAGFIVWLARQRTPLPGRSHCPNTVERFLRWQHLQRERGADHTEDAYCAELRNAGASHAEIAPIRASIAQFRRYLQTTG